MPPSSGPAATYKQMPYNRLLRTMLSGALNKNDIQKRKSFVAVNKKNITKKLYAIGTPNKEKSHAEVRYTRRQLF
jgi:hypothetical protein